MIESRNSFEREKSGRKESGAAEREGAHVEPGVSAEANSNLS